MPVAKSLLQDFQIQREQVWGTLPNTWLAGICSPVAWRWRGQSRSPGRRPCESQPSASLWTKGSVHGGNSTYGYSEVIQDTVDFFSYITGSQRQDVRMNIRPNCPDVHLSSFLKSLTGFSWHHNSKAGFCHNVTADHFRHDVTDWPLLHCTWHRCRQFSTKDARLWSLFKTVAKTWNYVMWCTGTPNEYIYF